jgi:hypothetical protein
MGALASPMTGYLVDLIGKRPLVSTLRLHLSSLSVEPDDDNWVPHLHNNPTKQRSTQPPDDRRPAVGHLWLRLLLLCVGPLAIHPVRRFG